MFINDIDPNTVNGIIYNLTFTNNNPYILCSSNHYNQLHFYYNQKDNINFIPYQTIKTAANKQNNQAVLSMKFDYTDTKLITCLQDSTIRLYKRI